MKYVYGRKKWLAAGIAALLISGTGAVSDVLAAPVYTSGITTKAKKDKATFGSAYKVENGVNKYNLEDGSKISIHGTYHAEGITPGKGTTSVVTVGDGTGTLSIDTSSSEAGNSQGAGQASCRFPPTRGGPLPSSPSRSTGPSSISVRCGTGNSSIPTLMLR